MKSQWKKKCPLLNWNDTVGGTPLQILESLPGKIRAAAHKCSEPPEIAYEWFPRPLKMKGLAIDSPEFQKATVQWLRKMGKTGHECICFNPQGDCLFSREK